MPKRLLKQIRRGQQGITGLETAIILIAFVVVAAVFSLHCPLRRPVLHPEGPGSLSYHLPF